jgi:tRNA(Ile2) C34 agmatinyltransferase TiaS
VWIGVDDTDALHTRGTGFLARELAYVLQGQFPVYGVTRHQLKRDPRIPMTAKNSAAAIHLSLDAASIDLLRLANALAVHVQRHAALGSDPGLCVARQVSPAVTAFGCRAQVEIVSQGEARALAAQEGLILYGLGGDQQGVIGALAAVGLAASGNDGRFILFDAIRGIQGVQPVAQILAAGVERVQTTSGDPVRDGQVDVGKGLRPAMVDGRPVLYVRPADHGQHWVAVRRD